MLSFKLNFLADNSIVDRIRDTLKSTVVNTEDSKTMYDLRKDELSL